MADGRTFAFIMLPSQLARKTVVKISYSKELMLFKIELAEYDIQRVQRIGVKKTSRNAKPRPVVVRFVLYQ